MVYRWGLLPGPSSSGVALTQGPASKDHHVPRFPRRTLPPSPLPRTRRLRRPLRPPRLLVALGTAAVLLPAAVLAPVVAPVSADTRYGAEAAQSALWLSGELVDGALPGPMPPNPDWGLTIDALIALEATGADPAAARQVSDAVAANVRSYNSHEDWVPGSEVRIGGATAKILYAAVISGADPTDFGGFDMRAETLDLVAGADAGAHEGRIQDRGTTDNSNTFGQSLGVLGLARSGGVPQETVDFLIRQQCSEGGFRLSPDQFGTPAPTCDEAQSAVLDPDSTGMAVQALLAAATDGAEGAEEAAALGADWLEEIQRADGSFGGSGPTAASNTNSTGLAAQALAAEGRQAAADDAAEWILTHQITASSGAAAADAGTIAYNRESFDSAVADGILTMQRDQWRRASAQALLGLAQVSLGEISHNDGPGTGPTYPPTATPTPTPAPDPTLTPDPTTDPTAGPTADPTTDPTRNPPPWPGGSTPNPSDQNTAPSSISPGAGPEPGRTADPGKNLAVTGAGLTALVAAALAMIVAGATLYLTTRRKAERA